MVNSNKSSRPGPIPFKFLSTKHLDLVVETKATRKLSSIVLPKIARSQVQALIDEQYAWEKLSKVKLKPRNRILLCGPSGTGKTVCANAIAYEMGVPLINLVYQAVVGSLLGETGGRLASVLDYVSTKPCVFFLDELDTLGADRNHVSDSGGEMRRVVNLLLLAIPNLPDTTIVVGATNHSNLLDSALWRRFQIRVRTEMPTEVEVKDYISEIQKTFKVHFGDAIIKFLVGKSYADMEEFCLSVLRQAVVHNSLNNIPNDINKYFDEWNSCRQAIGKGD